MIAVDTNILLRLAITDDVKQHHAVVQLLAQQAFWVSQTVALEAAWVLRARYQCPASEVVAIFENWMRTEGLHFEDATVLAQAIEHHKLGLDFADALHTLRTPEGMDFVTFDQPLVKSAKNIKHPKVRLLKGGK